MHIGKKLHTGMPATRKQPLLEKGVINVEFYKGI